MRNIGGTKYSDHDDLKSKELTIIVSNDMTGHRIQYLVAFFNRVSKSDRRIVLVLVSKIESNLSEPQILAMKEVDFDFIDDCGSSSQALTTVHAITAKIHVSEILFWDADNWIASLLTFRLKSRLLFMRPYLSDKSAKKISIFLLKWSAIFFFHFVRRFEIGILGVPYHAPKLLPSLWVDDALLISPATVTTTGESNGSKSFLTIPPDTRVVLVPGFISLRKNPGLVIEAMETVTRSVNGNVWLIFAGKSDLNCVNLINGYGKAYVKHFDRYLSDAEYRHLFLVADVVVLPYSNRGSSGITIESLAYGKHVIRTDSRLWAGAAGKTNGLLRLCSLNTISIANAIVHTLNEKESLAPVYLAGIARPTVIDFIQSSSTGK